jgi:molybdopterin synthase catalytic subunit
VSAKVVIQETVFDVAKLQDELLCGDDRDGAVAAFTGYVRQDAERPTLTGLHLEHYPGMTENSILEIIERAKARWPISRAGVVHRVGELALGDPIVWVGVASPHRAAAFSACEFIMDYLKTEAPLWKQERRTDGDAWVEARERDRERSSRWQQ